MSLVALFSRNWGSSLCAGGHAAWDPRGKSLPCVGVGGHSGQAPRQSSQDSYVAARRSQDHSCGSRVSGTSEVDLGLEAKVPQ